MADLTLRVNPTSSAHKPFSSFGALAARRSRGIKLRALVHGVHHVSVGVLSQRQ
jgi:hypothetical protein